MLLQVNALQKGFLTLSDALLEELGRHPARNQTEQLD